MARHTARHSSARNSRARVSSRIGRKPSPKGRRFAAAVLALVGLAGLGIASAAQLNLTTTPLGAGTEIVATCQGAGTITVGYTTGWNTSGTAAYKVSAVTFSGVNAACVGKAYRIQLLNASSAALGTEIVGTVPALGAGGTFSTAGIAAASQQRAQDLGGVAVIIVG